MYTLSRHPARLLLVAKTDPFNTVTRHQLQTIEMAARPYYMAPYAPHALERNATIEDAAQIFLEERHLSREGGHYHNDQNLAPLHYGYTYHKKDLGYAVPALPSQDQIVYSPLQHYYDDLDLLELGRQGRFQEPGPSQHDAADEELEFRARGRHRNRDLPHDAANEKLMLVRRGHCPNRDPLPYEVAHAGLEYGLRGRRPNRISPPYDTADDRFISDDDRRGRVHRHSFGIDWPPFAPSDTGIDGLDGGPLRQIYLGPGTPRSRSRLRGDHDLGPDRLDSLNSHFRRRLEPRLDDYISDYNIAMRRSQYDLGRAGVPPAAHYSSEHPFEANFENYASETNFREAHARLPLRPRVTGQRSDVDCRSVHQHAWNPTAAELMGPSYHVQRYDEFDAEERLQELRKSWNEAGYSGREPAIEHSRHARRDKRRHRSHAARSRPAARLFDSRLKASPCGERDVLLRPYHSRTRIHSTRIKRTSPPVAADPAAKSTASTGPRAQQHTQGTVGHAKHRDNARNNGTGPINASNKSGITHIQERAARETPSNMAHRSQVGLGDHGRSESSSDSDCYTPDDDSDVTIGGGGDDGDREGDVVQSFVHIEM